MPRSSHETPAPTPRSRKGIATRARLVEAGKAVFAEAGFLDARISDIAARAGLSHGSFYHYFDSKEQLFREVAEAQEALLMAPDDGRDERDERPSSELERLLLVNRRYLERYRDSGRIMGVIEEVSRYDQSVNEGRMQRQKHFAGRAERAIRRLQASGAADPEVDAEIAAVALGSMVARFAELWFVWGWNTFDFDQAVEQLTLLWANAIGLHDPPAPAPVARRPGGAKAATKAAAKAATPTTPRPRRAGPRPRH